MSEGILPFREFVLKQHSRCDLACDHCYVYEHQDTSWTGRPGAVPDRVTAATAARIAEHALAHALPEVRVVLHGGEPLLAGAARIRATAEALHRALAGIADLDLQIHTNGVRLDEEFCDLFAEFGIRVGLSLDGDRRANDLHRRHRDGRSSHAEVLRAVRLLQRPDYRHLLAGLLCTVDVRNDPAEVYRALRELEPPRIDFLLPHATWDAPPLRDDRTPTPYADWLRTVHALWEADGRTIPVRTFDAVHGTLAGLPSGTEALGLESAVLVVVETDGALEQADSLKTAYDGAPATGFHVLRDSFDQVAAHPGIRARQQGLAGLCRTCQECPVVRSCGGGLYAHRYRTPEPPAADPADGFQHPSVYCPDLLEFVSGVAAEQERRALAQPPTPRPDLYPELLSEHQFDQLAHGLGDFATVQALARHQREVNKQLLVTVLGQMPELSAGRLLFELDGSAPEALDLVLAHPYVRSWLLGCLGRGNGFRFAAPPVALARIAAATALRAGGGRPVRVPVRATVLGPPTLSLPTLGRAVFARTPPDEVLVDAEGPEPEQLAAWAERVGARWEPLRRVVLPGGPVVALEDTDPARGRSLRPHRATGRLAPDEFRAWERMLREAWDLVATGLPAYAEGMRAGLAAVTPLARPTGGGSDVSATGREAFGAVGIARPQRADVLAELLVHEFQHVKLGALLDLDDLCDPRTTVSLAVPWRDGRRPPAAALQGVYAHLAVLDHWAARARALDGTEEGRRARREYVRVRGWVSDVLPRLRASGGLTGTGERFVDGLDDSVRSTRLQEI